MKALDDVRAVLEDQPMTAEQIAEKLEVSISAVRNRLYRMHNIYVSGWLDVGSNLPRAIYSTGKGRNVPMPKKQRRVSQKAYYALPSHERRKIREQGFTPFTYVIPKPKVKKKKKAGAFDALTYVPPFPTKDEFDYQNRKLDPDDDEEIG